MAAFVSPLGLSTAGLNAVSLNRSSLTSRRRVRSFAPRNAVVHMCAEPSGENPAASSEHPPEPYPGFFAEMKKTGLSDAEAYAQAEKVSAQKSPAKSAKVGREKSLFKPDGTPYAPWMANYPTDYDSSVIKSKSDARGKLAADPQLAELSGVGVAWKMLGDELELKWSTGSEEGNLGFVVSRRAGRESEWKKIADYIDAPAELASKGPEGGTYSFLVTDPSPGSWVYRISDIDSKGNISDLSQTLVEIESEEDTNVRKLALAILIAVLLVALAAGLSLDPLSSA